MDVPYGGTRYSCREYIEDAMQERILPPHVKNPFGGNVYEGEVFNGVPHGQGTMTHPDGRVEKGNWEFDKLVKQQ